MAEQLTQVGYVGYSGTGYTYCTEIITNSQNIQANTSNITVNFKVMPTGNSAGYRQYANSSATMVITSNNGLSQSVDITGYKTANTRNQYTVIGTWTGTVNHTNDGSLQITCAVTYGFASGSDAWLPKRTSTTFSTYLEQIPRASDITLTTSSLTISGTSGTIGWTATSKADYYHTLNWTLGSSSTTVSGLNHLNNTSQSGTIAYTSLLSALPTASTGTLTLTLITYSNSAKTTEIGRKTATCSVSITIKPTTTLGNIAVASSPITNYAIAGYSTLSTSFSATTPSGATGRTTYFSISTGSMATTSSTSASGTATSNTLPSNVGTGTYTVTISAYTVDSRGNTGTTVSKSITCYQYTQPVANLTAIRTTQTGTTQDSGGSYLYVVFSGAVGSSINGQNSVQSVSCTSTGGVSGSLTSGTHYSLGTDASAKVTLTVTDKVGATNTRVVQVPTAVFPIDMYDNGAGTVGVGLGGIAEVGFTRSYLKNKFLNETILRERYASAPDRMLSSTEGYAILATITITGTYANAPILFTVERRGKSVPTNLYLFYNNANSTDITVNAFRADFYASEFWIYKSNTTTFQLITTFSGYDYPSITDVQIGRYMMDRTEIDYTISFISSVPSGATVASQYEVIASNATNATNAQTVNQWETTATARYPVFVNDNNSGTGTYEELHTSGSLMFRQSTNWASINIGTQAYRRGYLSLFDANSNYYADFTTTQGLTANRTVYIPNASGELLVRGNNYDTLWTGTLTGTQSTTISGGWSGGWSYYCIVGKCGSDSAFSTIMVPKGAITTSDTLWQLGSGSTYASFRLKYSGNDLIVTKVQSGSLTAVYGMR